MSGATVVFKYSRVKSNVLAPVSRDPVLQHMSAWHLRQHEIRVRSARPWEQAHVNPGRRRKKSTERQDLTQLNITNENLNRSSNKRPSSCTGLLISNSSTPSRPCGKTIRNTTPVLGPAHIKWQAHAASHAKQAQETQTFFQPRILESSATSRLRNSRHYQQPRVKKHPPSKPSPRNNAGMNERRAEAVKVWPLPSSCSSSSSGDSAYEAGGSSPPSRGSTPRLSIAQSRRSSKHSSASSEVSQLSNKQSQASVIAKQLPEEIPKEDINASSPQPVSRSEEESMFDTSFSPVQPLPRNNDLEYAMFEHDLMSEIVSAGLLTNSAVKQACRAHMATYQGRLEQDKMEEIICRLHKLLDVPSDDGYDLACFGLGSSTEVVTNQSCHLALAEEWAGLCKSREEDIPCEDAAVARDRDNVDVEEGYSSPVENNILSEES